MNKIISLACVLGMFAFIIPSAGAMPITTTDSAVEQSQVKGIINVLPKRLYKAVVQDNMITAHPKRRQSKTKYVEPVVQDYQIT